jgi:uncharacterized protein (DUF1501 family)
MAGGNDGINTVVPYANDFYHQARPRIGLKADARFENERRHRLSRRDDRASRNFTTPAIFRRSRASVIRTPTARISAPRKSGRPPAIPTAWKNTAGSAATFDNACAGADPAVGVTIGSQLPEAFFAKHPRAFVSTIRRITGSWPTAGDRGILQKIERTGNVQPAAGRRAQLPATCNSGGSIGMLPAGMPMTGGARWISSRAPRSTRSTVPTKSAHRRARAKSGRLSRLAAGQLPQAGRQAHRRRLPTRVYYVSQGGYDTHTNQVGTQQRLLQDLGDSMKAFVDDLKAQGNMQRVLVMTFSEFGRRVPKMPMAAPTTARPPRCSSSATR